MNILIVFETYSGGTMAAAEFVSKILSNEGNTVTLKRANEITLDAFNTFDFIIIATPSWLENGKEGQPHANFIALMNSSEQTVITGKKCAIFGLGDETYAHFARGADILAKFIEEKGGVLVTKPFKIDSYYVNTNRHEQQLTEWVKQLPLK